MHATTTQISANPKSMAAQEPIRVSRLWFPVVLLTLFWAFHFVAPHLEMAMFTRFISRMIVLALTVLIFLGWWLTNRQASRSDRWGALAIVLTGMGVAAVLSHNSINLFSMALTGLPIILTLWTGWLVLACKTSPNVQRIGLCVLILGAWSYCTLLRWNGLEGNQNADLRWRWEATPEEIFLAESAHKKTSIEKPTLDLVHIELLPGDWPEFRGPNRDNRVSAAPIATDWNAHPPKPLWRKRIGPAWSSPTIVDGFLFTQEQRGENEALVCYEATTGREVWIHEDVDQRFFEPLSGAGPRGTPTFSDGRIFTLGGKGRLNCCDATSGKLLWSRDIMAESGAALPQWGFSDSPLVVDGVVIVFAGGGSGGEKEPTADKGLLAYQVDTGEPAWSVLTGKNSYSSPELATIAGQRQVLMLSDRGLTSVEPSTGKVLWEHSLAASGTELPVIQPQVVNENEIVLQSSGALAMIAVTKQDDQWVVTPRWTSKGLKPSFCDLVLLDGNIYGFDDGIFCCLDLKTGERRWKRGRYGHGQVLLLTEQRLLLVLSEKGEAVLLAANPEKLDELSRFQPILGKTWNHPVVAHGRLYVRNDEEMACYELEAAP